MLGFDGIELGLAEGIFEGIPVGLNEGREEGKLVGRDGAILGANKGGAELQVLRPDAAQAGYTQALVSD